MMQPRGDNWPIVLTPAPGHAPPSCDPLTGERVLHIALQDSFERQPALCSALASLGQYMEIDWLANEQRLEGVFLAACKSFKPTLVFMQLQRPSPIRPDIIRKARQLCAATFINWDGDQHHEPNDKRREWFVELGKVCDASLVVNTRHPMEYYQMGVRHPGYLQIGIDGDIYKPASARELAAGQSVPIAFLGSKYSGIKQYSMRRAIISALHARFPTQLKCYGNGWPKAYGMPRLVQDRERVVYGSSSCAISMSIRDDLPHYSSDRLFRALGCGAVTLVQRFPGMADLGLADGHNCLIWSTVSELIELADYCISADPDEQAKLRDIRMEAEALVHARHTWKARMRELSYIVKAIR